MDYRKHLRDIKLDLITNKINLKISPPKIGGLFSFARPGNKIVKDLLKCGAVLTGSRALKCYEFDYGNNYKPILSRKPDDWDFIVDEKTLFKICDKYKFSDGIKKDSSGDYYVSIDSHLVRVTSSYGGETRVLKTNITLICKDEPSTVETKSGRIANLSYILEEKYKLSSNYYNISNGHVSQSGWSLSENKHDSDLKQIITRISGF